MTRQFMVGTVDDKPLLIVTLDNITYFVDLDTKVVYEDKPGLPELKDEPRIERILKATEEIK